MSTSVYLVCIDHDPPIRADSECGQHGEVDRCRTILGRRDDLLRLSAECDYFFSTGDRWTDNGLHFFKTHPRCRVACEDEYGRWTDLGMGLPPGVRPSPEQEEADALDPRPCLGRNTNVCVAEGCHAEDCLEAPPRRRQRNKGI